MDEIVKPVSIMRKNIKFKRIPLFPMYSVPEPNKIKNIKLKISDPKPEIKKDSLLIPKEEETIFDDLDDNVECIICIIIEF